MIKNIIISILILSILTTPIIAQPIDIEFPYIEHECYEEYAKENVTYNFEKRQSPDEKSTNITIIIDNFEEICKYSEKPTKCYECIALKKYGIDRDNQEKSQKKLTTNIILISVIIILILVIIYQIKKGRKKSKKKK
ncbi:hypothetical protein J4216_04040 [Candidatus Woesearchaeota archaeon]|nr:hypothetical protein [Candidatus Woesearchaeota archaeon]